MAARKLQSEIDRTLKRVGEGVEVFEGLYEKLQLSTNQTQKEKLEADLKTQIKKLQRLRDQIKTWIQSNDIKDKKPLTDNRRLIETQMERFKAIEKEMKTKAFSKEGLILAAKMDPTEKAKMEMSNWLAGMVDELSRQIEASEAEIEQLAGQGKKSKKGGPGAGAERTAELESQNERRSWHVSRLEILHRMLENGTLETEAIDEIKEDISYYVESNAEEDFEEDEGIYDDFNLEEQEEEFGLQQNDDMQSSHDSASVAEDPPKTPVKENATVKRRDSEAEPVKKDELKRTARRQTSESSAKDKVPSANFPQTAAKAGVSAPPPSSTAAVVSPPRAPAAAALPPIRYAAAAAAAVAAPPASVSPSTASSAAPTASADAADDVAPSETQEESGVTRASPAPSQGPGASNASVSQQASNSNSASIASTPALDNATANAPNGSSSADTESSGAAAPVAPPPGLSGAASSLNTASPSPAYASAQSPAVSHAPSAEEQRIDGEARGVPGSVSSTQGAASADSEFQPAQLAASSAAAGVVQPVGGGAGTSQQQQAAQRQHGTDARLPGSLADLVSSFESAKQKSMRRDRDLTAVHKSLESSFMNVPEPMDSEKPKYYIPKNPFPTAAYYPQSPASVFDNPALYSKFDVDTLFYIFYYQQGTYHQYLAARELKKQSWRFHKQYLTWFQRHSEPQAITDEYEQGVYVYFDWEGSWCQRKKSDFRFEYRWLEEN